jgi:uncharacterized protein (DUF362 family)
MVGKVSRREFLRRAVVAGAAFAGATARSGLGPALAASDEAKSRIVRVTDDSAIFRNGSFPDGIVRKMVADGICKLAGSATSALAWKSFFSPDDVVGIKINCLFGKGASTHFDVVDAIVEGLLSAGLPARNIIIWDRSMGDLTRAGYGVKIGGPEPRCLASDQEWGDEIANGSFKGRLTTILTRDITALINVPILKSHGTMGITCALKNHFGSISNPGQYHDDSRNAAIADINSLPAIKDKTRLVIVDALRPLADGGPGLSKPDTLWDCGSVLMSTDPVAADYVGWRIIEKRRKELRLKPLPQPSRWLANATARGLGNCDPGRIELVNV